MESGIVVYCRQTIYSTSFLVFGMVVYGIVVLFFLYTLVFVKTSALSFGVAVVVVFGSFVLYRNYLNLFELQYRIEEDESKVSLIFTNKFGKRTVVQYANIVSVTSIPLNELIIRISFTNVKGDLDFVKIDPDIKNFGSLIELVLKASPNLHEFKLHDSLFWEKHWQKEPDLGILEEVKQTAK